MHRRTEGTLQEGGGMAHRQPQASKERMAPQDALAAALGEKAPGSMPSAMAATEIRCCHDPMEDPCCVGCFKSTDDCFAMVEALNEKCGEEYVKAAQRIYQLCCGYDITQDLSTFRQFGNVEQGPPCPNDGTDYQDQNNRADYNGGSPYNCGNDNSDSGGLTGKVVEGLFNLADDGMCAIFNETCQNGAGGKSVYCCRQSAGNDSRSVQGLGAAKLAGDDENAPTQRCGPSGPPPDWVPNWAPAGYTSNQYLQAMLLAALTGLSLAYLLGALFGEGDGQQQRQQRAPRPRGQTEPQTVVVTGQQARPAQRQGAPVPKPAPTSTEGTSTEGTSSNDEEGPPQETKATSDADQS